LFALYAVAASACGRGGDPSGEVETVAQEAPGVVRRSWRASNEQARTVGGDLTISLEGEAEGENATTVLAFVNGVTVRATPGATSIDGLNTILGAPDGVTPRLYRVVQERVSPSARLGGLCGGLRTSYVAFAEYVGEGGEWTLRIASFHQPADPIGAAPNLCFSLDYALAVSAR
jgi:hypothetical protein